MCECVYKETELNSYTSRLVSCVCGIYSSRIDREVKHGWKKNQLISADVFAIAWWLHAIIHRYRRRRHRPSRRLETLVVRPPTSEIRVKALRKSSQLKSQKKNFKQPKHVFIIIFFFTVVRERVSEDRVMVLFLCIFTGQRLCSQDWPPYSPNSRFVNEILRKLVECGKK